MGRGRGSDTTDVDAEAVDCPPAHPDGLAQGYTCTGYCCEDSKQDFDLCRQSICDGLEYAVECKAASGLQAILCRSRPEAPARRPAEQVCLRRTSRLFVQSFTHPYGGPNT